ncbi:GNAT family N-acetyltransferase [Arsenicicoccus sp. oral taxon 190]|uniref:GNAT family N-acetyltransferase n=1 Tax=Arsenicicoccus sp. oral taxon 190 TaxID=1658671 RepID=UPI00067D7893|nr:GNAT family N-acetyltransferase [Arsenicicoccus sp. oral taxon 190]
MSRSLTVVRSLEVGDGDALFALWSQAVADGALVGETAGRPLTQDRLEQVLARSGVYTLVAAQDDELVGFTIATASPLSALTDAGCVTLEVLYVSPAARGRGVGHQLLAKATLLAEQTGATHVATNVPSQGRDLNRFFARMGFVSTVTRRITTPAALRRRLAGEDVRPFDRVLARRRSLRARTGLTQPLPVLDPTARVS